ncbi:MAG: ribonuclease PH [Thermoanaerobaculia bacterium]|nr:ribonuclease PH [Thermoanaerobaculia bacterium]MCZ7652772.1 ribonuclease PH [Thermoanaerobaculia bacterium]
MNTPSSPSRRLDGRPADALRPVRLTCGVLKHAEGSVLIEAGDTRVLVAATVENRVPSFLAGRGRGWVTAEYAMLPRATNTRSQREVQAGRPSGRTAEIQRLIGRSLRAVVDTAALGERTLILDCDVLQADAGTRTAAITGAHVAMTQALARLYLAGDLPGWPVTAEVAAVSVGICGGVALLDLDFEEDQGADVDMNVVATGDGEIIEVQGTAERRRFRRAELDRLLDLALGGIERLAEIQREALAGLLAEVAERQRQPRRSPAPAKDERELWRGRAPGR